MKEKLTKWIVLLVLCLAAYVQYTGCSIAGLPAAVQPPLSATQAACVRGIAYVGSSCRASAKAAQPHISAAKGACSSGFRTIGAKLAPLAGKLVCGYEWAVAKVRGAFHSEGTRQKASSVKRHA